MSGNLSQGIRGLIVICAVLVFRGVGGAADAGGILVKDGQANGCIVVSESAGRGRVLTAANDLAGYVQRMSGAILPLGWDGNHRSGFRILIGSTALAPVEPSEVTEKKVGFDGFIIRSVPDGVVIAGRTPQGTANGIYYFAEEVLGLHWFSPEDDAPTCPQRRTIEIPAMELTVKPDFAFRDHGYTVVSKYLPAKVLANHERWAAFNRVGGITAAHAHFLSTIIPDSLYDAHPEYFPLIHGKRTRGDVSVQRCLSNPDVITLAIDCMANWFDKYPNACFASLSPNDGLGWCECDNCKKMGTTPSHRILAFCNAVAAANEAQYPDRGYMFYAYLATLTPPTGMKAHRNVIPVIAPMGLCLTHPISSNCPDRIYMRSVYEGWQQIANGRIAWYYYIYGGPFCLPGVITMAEEMRFARDHGSIGGYREHTCGAQTNWAMVNWVEVKLMWNVDLDVVKLRRQFIEGYYGLTAANSVERVYKQMEQGLRNSPVPPRAEGAGKHMSPYSDAFNRSVRRCSKDIDTALKIARTEKNPAYRRRIAQDMGSLRGKVPDDLKE